jgi:SecD/SecF fusion protein
MKWFRKIYSFDYMGHKYWFFAISATIIGIGLISLFVRGGGDPLHGLNYGLEFNPGTRVTVSFVKPATTGDVHGVLAQQGYGDAVVQQITGKNQFQVQIKQVSSDQVQQVRNALDKRFTIATQSNGEPDYSASYVGATFGRMVITASTKAIVLALLLILAYVWLRFAWKFAVGAIAAEFHDLLVVVGVYSLTGREVTTGTIAAVLTILGYSLYDTVIVFDRIRENAPHMSRIPYGDMVNRSIWQTLTRSINTTLMTLIPVLCLFLFGGETLKDFAFALLVGVASGAYSSIFVASPITCLLKEREPQYRKLAARARAAD